MPAEPPVLRLVATGTPPAPPPVSNLRQANIWLGRIRQIPILGKIS